MKDQYDTANHQYGLSLMESLALGYTETQYYHPDIQKIIDKNPDKYLIKVLDLCHKCNTVYVKEEVDLRKDLIQIDHKLLLTDQCQTCGHNKLNHDIELRKVHPEKLVEKEGWGMIWFIPYTYTYKDLVPDFEKITPEHEYFGNCQDCSCECFVPRSDDKVWALYNKAKDGKRFISDIEYERSLTIMEILWLRKSLKEKQT